MTTTADSKGTAGAFEIGVDSFDNGQTPNPHKPGTESAQIWDRDYYFGKMWRYDQEMGIGWDEK